MGALPLSFPRWSTIIVPTLERGNDEVFQAKGGHSRAGGNPIPLLNREGIFLTKPA